MSSSDVKSRKPNKLINERSPYLLQHAYNPVNWYPWSDEAFETARKENKPIFLSIGYSTCHWCHVMEKESFEDSEVAELLNENLISIKVDREERPDIDSVYMTVCQMLTGSGGWPLNVIMTPDKKPFFAGTYFPKKSTYGRAGMMDLVPKIMDVWRNNHDDVIISAEKITRILSEYSEEHSGGELGLNEIEIAYKQLSAVFDEINGGFGTAPKFPTPHNLLFLLRYWKRTKNNKALDMVEKTLQKMTAGGIYDHIGFGFHRYSTDTEWLLPHFEKMLYDQALISYVFAEAYQITKKPFYSKILKEICLYVLRDMASSLGPFYSAEDADSEGEEGKFYIWSYDEISAILDANEMKLFSQCFCVEKEGNYTDEAVKKKTGKNIIFTKEIDLICQKDIPPIKEKLFKTRELRVHPHKDDKVLTSWNGLMIASLSKAGRVLNEPLFTEAAKKAADFILREMYKNKVLFHVYREKEIKIPGYADDYAFFVWGLLELYESTFETKYLKHAVELNNELISDFWDEETGGFYFTSQKNHELIVRMKDSHDAAIPSSNSVSILNMCKIAYFTEDLKLKDKALKTISALSYSVKKVPVGYAFLLSGLNCVINPGYEILIVGSRNSNETQSILNYLNSLFLPNAVILFKDTDCDNGIDEIAGFTNKYSSVNGKCTVYICKDYKCSLPVTSLDELVRHELLS